MTLRASTLLTVMVMLLASSCKPSAPSSPTQAPATIPQATQVPPASPVVNATQSIPPTPAPSDTPLPTFTPEGGQITDDFSSRSDIWGDCEQCEWKDGALYFGPFLPAGSGEDQIFYVICEACGENTYYRVAADVTYFEGYGSDRTFGILAGLTSGNLLGAGTITTRQHALYETFDFNTNSWGGTPFTLYGAVRPGFATNRIEVILKPASTASRADIFVNINDRNVIVLFDQRVEPSRVGLYLGWHSVGVLYDNFEFERLEPVN